MFSGHEKSKKNRSPAHANLKMFACALLTEFPLLYVQPKLSIEKFITEQN
jgi:hypothetical protein